MPATKQCSKCKEIKDVIYFGKQTSAKDGLARTCKPCNYIGHKNLEQHLPENGRPLLSYAEYIATNKPIDKSKYGQR